MNTLVQQLKDAVATFQTSFATYQAVHTMSLSEAGSILLHIQQFHQLANQVRVMGHLDMEGNYLVVVGSRLCDKLHQCVLERLQDMSTSHSKKPFTAHTRVAAVALKLAPAVAPKLQRDLLCHEAYTETLHPHPELLEYEQAYMAHVKKTMKLFQPLTDLLAQATLQDELASPTPMAPVILAGV
ncbi:MAG: hypothetical protein ACKO37_09860 [Vampirovibrionales bacterium]